MNSQTQVSWSKRVEESRKAKEAFFATSHDSPLAHQETHSFKRLNYFPPDMKYRIETELHRYPNPEEIAMTTSKGTRQQFHRVGYFEFEILGKKVRVQTYKSAEREDAELFIPFKDATSGRESYGAARYLDLEETPDDKYTLDFNYAYNPSCAYSDDYICPLPPRENWLDVEIRAGEKKYHD